MSGSEYAKRVESVHRRYVEDREAFEAPSPTDVPAEDRATTLLRDGFGQVVKVYLDGHTGGRNVKFTADEMDDLHAALNGYLELYARCYGVEIDPDVTIRKAAEMLIDTHNVCDVAQMLTHVPEKHA